MDRAARQALWPKQERALPYGKTIVEGFPPGEGGCCPLRTVRLRTILPRVQSSAPEFLNPRVPLLDPLLRRGPDEGAGVCHPLGLHRKRTYMSI